MGDSVMALFGAPISLGNDSLRAVRCAIEMQQAVEVFNRERSARNLPPVEMGIGINTGAVIAGNIGSAERMEYTVIGDSVNIAARLQGLARPGEILISQATYLQVRDRVKATAMETMTLKGKTLTVAVYRLEGLR
jgi:class 3 adenylate cyclase